MCHFYNSILNLGLQSPLVMWPLSKGRHLVKLGYSQHPTALLAIFVSGDWARESCVSFLLAIEEIPGVQHLQRLYPTYPRQAEGEEKRKANTQPYTQQKKTQGELMWFSELWAPSVLESSCHPCHSGQLLRFCDPPHRQTVLPVALFLLIEVSLSLSMAAANKRENLVYYGKSRTLYIKVFD